MAVARTSNQTIYDEWKIFQSYIGSDADLDLGSYVCSRASTRRGFSSSFLSRHHYFVPSVDFLFSASDIRT